MRLVVRMRRRKANGDEMSIDYSWLEKHVFQRELSEQDRKSIGIVMRRQCFASGDTIIMENEAGGELYLLKSGRVDVLLHVEGEHIKLSDLGEGAQLGDMSFIDDAKASATITARENCVVYRITRDDLSSMFIYHQSVARDLTFSIMRNMSRNLRRMNHQSAPYLK